MSDTNSSTAITANTPRSVDDLRAAYAAGQETTDEEDALYAAAVREREAAEHDAEERLALQGRVPDEVAPTGLRALAAAEVMSERPPVAIIEGVAWAGRVQVLVSESGAGKTFLLLGAEAAVADGRDWHGRATRRGSVVHVSFEGDALGLRLRALQEAGFSLEGVHVLRAGDPLSPRVASDGSEIPSIGEVTVAEALADLAERLRRAGKPPIVLIVVDTVRASLAGSEDSSEDVSAYLRAARRLLAPYPDAACVLAHHAGWQDGEQRRKRERGSSAFRGNADATLYLEVTEEDGDEHLAFLTLRSLKVRDDERPVPLRLVRRRVFVAELDERGDPRTTCIIERDSRRREEVEAARVEAEVEALAKLEEIAIEIISNKNNSVTSIASLRSLLGCQQKVASDLIGRLEATGRIARGSKRDPYRIVPNRTDSEPGTIPCETQPYRTAASIGGTGTVRAGCQREGSGGANRTGAPGPVPGAEASQ